VSVGAWALAWAWAWGVGAWAWAWGVGAWPWALALAWACAWGVGAWAWAWGLGAWPLRRAWGVGVGAWAWGVGVGEAPTWAVWLAGEAGVLYSSNPLYWPETLSRMEREAISNYRRNNTRTAVNPRYRCDLKTVITPSNPTQP
jgi:hypothetical protein